MADTRVEVEDGKFTVILHEGGSTTVLRYGGPWPAYENGVTNLEWSLATELAEAREEITTLKTALHDAIRRPMGVVPHTAEAFYSPAEADMAEARRPKLTPISPPGW